MDVTEKPQPQHSEGAARKDRESTRFRPRFKGVFAKINMAFTETSFLPAMLRPNSEGTSEATGIGTMAIWIQLTHYASAFREFVAPTYRPERHYMRGPGPACARRHRGTFEAPATFH